MENKEDLDPEKLPEHADEESSSQKKPDQEEMVEGK
jgi:hypothetical protein